jgi:hypothetical protein
LGCPNSRGGCNRCAEKQTEEAVIENNLNSQEQQENMAAAGDKQEKLAVNEWQVVRQSKRGKDQEQRSNGKEGNSAERITQDKVEGNMSITKNSFAVLDSSKLIDIAGNMGIDRGVLSFDNIDMLRDLEIARAALNNPVIPMNMESSENLEENSPFSENNIGGWQTDESESEVCPIASSIKKKKENITKRQIMHNRVEVKRTNLWMVSQPLPEINLWLALDLISGIGKQSKRFTNDRSHLELQRGL